MKKKLVIGGLFLSTMLLGAETGTTEFQPKGYWGTWAKFKSNGVGRDTTVGEKWGWGHESILFENEIEIQATPKLWLYLDDKKGVNYPGYNETKQNTTQFKMTYYNGKIGNTKLSFQQYFRYIKSTDKSTQFRYKPRINFGEYLGGVVYFGIDFDHHRYDEEANYKSKSAVMYDIDGTWQLGKGFSLEVESYGYLFSNTYDNAKRKNKDIISKTNSAVLISTLNYNNELYNANGNILYFHAELVDTASFTRTKDRGSDYQHGTANYLTSDINFAAIKKLNQVTDIYMKPGIAQYYYIEHQNHSYGVNGYIEVGVEVSF